jgi:site-specific recombinase XerD
MLRRAEIQDAAHGSGPRRRISTAWPTSLDQNSLAKNTRRSYRSDWVSWLAFCERHRIKPLPADPANVRRYLTQLGAVGGRKGAKLKPKTAQRHLAAIAAAHRASRSRFRRAASILKRTMNGILRTYGARQEGARALRAEDIAAICKTFSLDLRSVRNKAIILLGFAGGFRRSEIVALDVSDLAFEDERAARNAPPLENGSERGGENHRHYAGEHPGNLSRRGRAGLAQRGRN